MPYDMRTQLSLELLVYIVLAGLSITFALSGVSKSLTGSSRLASAYEMTQFVTDINVKILEGSVQFNEFIPSGICNATTVGSELFTSSGSFYFIRPVNLANLCPDDTYATLCLEGNSTRLVLGRLK
jgi:hypothetical protein